jgi:hypothetical protein
VGSEPRASTVAAEPAAREAKEKKAKALANCLAALVGRNPRLMFLTIRKFTTSLTMPKTPANVDDLMAFLHDHVRPAGQISDMQSVVDSKFGQGSADN